MKRIGIISDTHGLLRDEVIAGLQGCDLILHGGDVNRQEILDRLQEIALLHTVRGNNDKQWAEYLPDDLRFAVEGLNFYMVHNRKLAAKDLSGIDVVIFGHSHKYTEMVEKGIFWLNPGSCGKRRFDQQITYAVMTVEGREYSVEKKVIPQCETK